MYEKGIIQKLNRAVDHVKDLEDKIDQGLIEVDDSLSLDSENPVQNKVITDELDDKLDQEDTMSSQEITNIFNSIFMNTRMKNSTRIYNRKVTSIK